MDSVLKVKGIVTVQVHQNGVLVDEFTKENIVLYQGKAAIINDLVYPTAVIIARMAVGDQGTIPSDPRVPKIVNPQNTTLFHEVYRQDLSGVSITTNVATNSAQFTAIFRAADIPLTSYADQVKPVISEVALVLVDSLIAPPLPRTPVAAPNAQHPAETLFSIRTFNAIPFEAASGTTISIKYTIMII